jgi:general secretion pathway protein I
VTRGASVRGAGFTLVEVMVALAIVAITLGAGSKAAGALADNAERARQVSAAQWCADNQLVGLRLAAQFPNVGSGEFGCEQLGRSYRGTMTVRASFNPNFRIVETRVADENGVPLVSLQTIAGRY